MATTTAAVETGQRLHPLVYPVRALRHSQFRSLWAGQTLTTVGQWMDQFTRGWLIYTLTGSAVHLAFVSAARALPLLFFGLYAGVLADRMDRKKLLMVSQTVNVVLNVALAALIITGQVEVWHIYLTGVLAGIGMAAQQPARQSIIPAIVPKEDLQNAVVLNAGTLNIGQAIGPALGGLLVAAVGMGATYSVQAGIFLLAVLTTFSMIDPPQVKKRSGPSETVIQSMKAGFAYVRTNDIVLTLLFLATVPMFFGNPYQSLIPLFASDILDLGAADTGILVAATGVGSVASLVVMAALPPFKRRGAVLLISTMLYGLSIVLFAGANMFWIATGALVLAGFMRSTYRAINHTMLLEETADEYRGRVNSMYLMDRGLVPLGTMLLGLLAALLGPANAVFIMGAICTVGVLVPLAISPRLWKF